MNHPNLSDAINSNLAKSEIDGGVFLSRLAPGTKLEVQTKNTLYRIEVVEGGSGKVEIQGHPRYCPDPTPARIHGSIWGGSMLKMNFIGRGMNLEFSTDSHPQAISTSTIQEVTEINDMEGGGK